MYTHELTNTAYKLYSPGGRTPTTFEVISRELEQTKVTLCWVVTNLSGIQFKRDVQDCQQRLSSAFDLLLIFLCSLIQTLTH